MLSEVADRVFVRQSAFCLSNAVVIRGEEGLLLVDPGVDGDDLAELAADVAPLARPVIAGFSTHPHWDHLLWDPRFGDVPRYATARGAAIARERLDRARSLASRQAPGAPIDLLGRVTPLPAGAATVPWAGPRLRILEHRAHCPAHSALLVEGTGVLLGGDMLSDVEIPLLDPDEPDPLADYVQGLDLLESAITSETVTVLVPGHGGVARGAEIAARIAADRAYVDALRRGEGLADPRVGPRATYGRD
ncbi:MAG: MBL fold metallo-hydrolase, partial [Candidatus Dormibacteraceae bacterium]